MLVNPEWEEQEMKELEAERKAAEGDDLTPLGMHVPSWWQTWQVHAAAHNSYIGLMTGNPAKDDSTAFDISQAAYERGWRDAVKAIQAAILAATKGSD